MHTVLALRGIGRQAGRLDLAQLAALVISADTGVAHLSHAYRTSMTC